MFCVIKKQHEERDGDFTRKVEERFFVIGKKVAKTCSVFLHATMRHTADEWWLNEGVEALLMSGDVDLSLDAVQDTEAFPQVYHA